MGELPTVPWVLTRVCALCDRRRWFQLMLRLLHGGRARYLCEDCIDQQVRIDALSGGELAALLDGDTTARPTREGT